MPQNPLFKVITTQEINILIWVFCEMSYFIACYRKTNKNFRRDCSIKNFYCYFCIFYCLILAVSWFSFVLSFCYNFRKINRLKLKFGQWLQFPNIFWTIEYKFLYRSKFYCSKGLFILSVYFYCLAYFKGLIQHDPGD